MRLARGQQCVDRHLQATIGSVLESHRGRQPARQLSMDVRFGRPRTDRRPCHVHALPLARTGAMETTKYTCRPHHAVRSASTICNLEAFSAGRNAPITPITSAKISDIAMIA